MLDATIDALALLTRVHREVENQQCKGWEREFPCQILFNARLHLRRSIEVYLTGKERT